MIIKNNIRILSFIAMLFCSISLSAQTVIDDFDDEEEDEEEVDSLFVPMEDEIAVTDKEGNEELTRQSVESLYVAYLLRHPRRL